jgi:segregation and condensation protein B
VEATGFQTGEIRKALERLRLRHQSGGLRLQIMDGRVLMITAAEYAGLIEKYLGLEATARLSRAAQEALSIIAYKQPVTRPGIDSIRGVNSDGVLHSLMAKGLIQEVGRSEGPGRPILYGVTDEFLLHFGLESLDQMPELETKEDNGDDDLKLLKD